MSQWRTPQLAGGEDARVFDVLPSNYLNHHDGSADMLAIEDSVKAASSPGPAVVTPLARRRDAADSAPGAATPSSAPPY